MERKALITGVSGQDGAYLAYHLLSLGYVVCGTTRTPGKRPDRLKSLGIAEKIRLVETPTDEPSAWAELLKSIKPDEIYHLAAQTSLSEATKSPYATVLANSVGPISLLEALRVSRPEAKLFLASSAQVFGGGNGLPLGPDGPFAPTNLYGACKLFTQQTGEAYRTSHGLFISHGILFAHESPLRGKEFLSRKVTSTLAAIRVAEQEVLEIGNLDAERDWGYAPDFVRGMQDSLQLEHGAGYVFASGEVSTVRDLISAASEALGFDLEWIGSGVDEYGVDRNSGKTIVKVNPAFFRPFKEQTPLADISMTKEKLGWKPSKGMKEIIAEMCIADSEIIRARGSRR